ncbi:MAG: hypothetical protein COT73_00740 [Bdellovibrio sp. CG10_big_fil_rev_8_21_14_0_10_47_8]|nr:MAG: hypothetical protein COT73_00740 [Bdellovibrio sp. CG10_big_fil_rev_8_21_14_0_10_47_8]
MNNRKVLVYQAYGIRDIIHQTIFSITSLLSKTLSENLNLEIWIYTDQELTFSQFFGDHVNIKIVPINMEQVKKWRGQIDFVHRVKVEILKDAAGKFNGPIFYCDGDTYFLSSPTELFSHVNDRFSLMHTAENALAPGVDPLSKKILHFTKNNHFQVGHETIGIGPSTVMWNAGVLGLSQKNKSFLPMALEMTDQMYARYRKHVMEQLAFSFILQTKSQIMAADQVVYHYWNQKDEYQQAIDDFLKKNKNIKEALENLSHFSWPPAPAPKSPKRALVQKILQRFKRPRAKE